MWLPTRAQPGRRYHHHARCLAGKRDKLLGVFPPAGLGSEQFDRLARLGTCVAGQLPSLAGSENSSLLRGQGAVELNRRYVLPELVGWYVFSIWARLLRHLKGRAPWAFNPGIYGFMLFLLATILFLVPLLMVVRWLFNPILKRPLATYIRLSSRSGPRAARGVLSEHLRVGKTSQSTGLPANAGTRGALRAPGIAELQG